MLEMLVYNGDSMAQSPVKWMSIVLRSSTEVDLEAFGLKQQSSQSTMFDINTPVHVWCHKTFRWMKWICSEPEA